MEGGVVAQHLEILQVELLDQEVPEPLALEDVAGHGLALVGELLVGEQARLPHLLHQVVVLETLPEDGKVVDFLELADMEAVDALCHGHFLQVVDDLGFAGGRPADEDDDVECLFSMRVFLLNHDWPGPIINSRFSFRNISNHPPRFETDLVCLSPRGRSNYRLPNEARTRFIFPPGSPGGKCRHGLSPA